jgi:putative peptidoglycan lipid II flippase
VSELIGASADPSLPPGEGLAGSAGGHGSNLRRATVGMAAGTALSRLTGVGRILALAYALGFSRLADAYNLANTTPNMLYDIVLGGVL